jgi:hypothetical protein
MSKDFKFVSAVRIEEGTSIWVTELDGTPITADEIVLTAGLYYITNDNTASDLLRLISIAFSGSGYDDVVFTIDTGGIVSMSYEGSTSMKIQWSDAGAVGRSSEYVRDFIRHESFGDGPYLINATEKVGARAHVGGFYPTYYLIDDLTNREPQASILVPDTGNAQVIYVADRKRFDLQVRTDGYPRTSGFSEYHDLEAWWQHAITGTPTRLYPDVTVTAVYSTSQRYGYQTMTVIPDDFDPQPEDANWYRHHTYSFRGVEYTE